jgi:hypothetical protein
MMSSMMWACLILSRTTLYSVSGTTWCCCITRPVVLPDMCPTAVALGCSHTVAARLTELPA